MNTAKRKRMRTSFIFAILPALFFTLGLAVPVSATMQVGNTVILFAGAAASTIQNAVDSLPAEGGTVKLNAGVYTLSQGIHIDRSNVTFMGESGTVLRLNDSVDQPVILVGTDAQTPVEGDEIQNVRISNLEIDGNKDNQNQETDPDRSWIRNNGIDVRRTRNLWIGDLNVYNAVSGGLVVSWNSSKVFAGNSMFHHNQFDGIALYASEDIQIADFMCYENESAGLSLDNNLSHVIFHDGSIKNNGDVGIFARDSEDLSFFHLVISDNGSHGCFMSHQEPGTGTGVARLVFSACSFLDNSGDGLHLGSTTADSPDNAVVSCLFSGNTGTALYVIDGGAIDDAGCVYQ